MDREVNQLDKSIRCLFCFCRILALDDDAAIGKMFVLFDDHVYETKPIISRSAAIAKTDGLIYCLSFFAVSANKPDDSTVAAPSPRPVSISLVMSLVAKIDMMYWYIRDDDEFYYFRR